VGTPAADVKVREAVLEVLTEESAGADLSLTFQTYGCRRGAASRTLHATREQTSYQVGLGLMCRAIQIRVRYQGLTPPEILSMGVIRDEKAAR